MYNSSSSGLSTNFNKLKALASSSSSSRSDRQPFRGVRRADRPGSGPHLCASLPVADRLRPGVRPPVPDARRAEREPRT